LQETLPKALVATRETKALHARETIALRAFPLVAVAVVEANLLFLPAHGYWRFVVCFGGFFAALWHMLAVQAIDLEAEDVESMKFWHFAASHAIDPEAEEAEAAKPTWTPS